MAIKYCPNSRRDTYRVAVVVSRKVAKSAPVRNRIRRRIYELLRTQKIASLGNLDIVVTIFDEGVAEVSSSDLKNTIDQLVSDMTATH
jgi:ribonuclease P protein component